MKVAKSVLLVAVVLLIFVGVALAGEMSGKVTAVDAGKNTLTLNSETMEVSYDNKGSLLRKVKVGNTVSVEYIEAGGKKTVIKITQMKKKASAEK